MANAEIEGKQCTLFYDYDCANGVLSSLSDDGKIEWLQRRMNMVFLDPMKILVPLSSPGFALLNQSFGDPPITGMLMMVSIIMNGIEALGSFLGKRSASNYENFELFVIKYLPEWAINIPSPYYENQSLAKIMWKSYRNGLAHSFAILHAGIEPIPGSDKYRIADEIVQIDVWKLFEDLQTAVVAMFNDVFNDPIIKKQFLCTFNKVYTCPNGNTGKMHTHSVGRNVL